MGTYYDVQVTYTDGSDNVYYFTFDGSSSVTLNAGNPDDDHQYWTMTTSTDTFPVSTSVITLQNNYSPNPYMYLYTDSGSIKCSDDPPSGTSSFVVNSVSSNYDFQPDVSGWMTDGITVSSGALTLAAIDDPPSSTQQFQIIVPDQ